MTEQVLNDLDVGARSSARPIVWLSLEFLLLFVTALWIANIVLPGLSGTYPNPLWLPLVVLSIQHGVGAAIVASIIAGALQYALFLPAQGLTEDIYDYVARVTAEPIGWTFVAVLIGSIRQAQIREKSRLQAALAARSSECAVVAKLCDDMRRRAEMLERHIAVNLPASHIDAAEAIAGLHAASSENFSERLTRFVNLMLGSSEFALYLLRGNALKLLFQSAEFDLSPADYLIASDSAVFDAVVRERRTIRPTGADVAGGRGFLFGPIFALDQNRVIGMLAVGGAERDDFPEDIDRCFALTASEISRLLGRVILTEPPRDAARYAPNIEPMTRPVFSDAIASTMTGEDRANQASYVPLSRVIRG